MNIYIFVDYILVHDNNYICSGNAIILISSKFLIIINRRLHLFVLISRKRFSDMQLGLSVELHTTHLLGLNVARR